MDRRRQVLSWDSRGMVSASLAVAVGFALSCAGSFRGWEFAIWWPGVGLVAIVVLQREFRCWTCAAVNAGATELLLWRGLFDLSWSDAATASLSHQLTAVIAAWSIRYGLERELTFRSPQQLLLRVVPAILAAPLLGSILSGLAFSSSLMERLPASWM